MLVELSDQYGQIAKLQEAARGPMWILQDADVPLGSIDRTCWIAWSTSKKLPPRKEHDPVLARLRSRYPEVSTRVVATSIPDEFLDGGGDWM